MSCGLGAIVLVFMLVKRDIEHTNVETGLLQQDLTTLQAQQSALEATINAKAQSEGAAADDVAAVSSRLAALQQELARAQAEAAAQAREKAQLEKTIEATEVPQQTDIVQSPRGGEENYVIGLAVSGARIGILVDMSSSMTDETLLDVIRRKNGSDAEKRNGPKWQRTKAIVTWILARAPATASIRVIGFNKTTHDLDGGTWIKGGDAKAAAQTLKAVDAAVPSGSTNLEAGLRAINDAGVSDLYLITDGLPTDGTSGYKSLNPFSNCSALWGGSSKISGECRARLFNHTVANVALKNVIVNVILLPIEGDPEAAYAFWRWTGRTGGITISPAYTWP